MLGERISTCGAGQRRKTGKLLEGCVRKVGVAELELRMILWRKERIRSVYKSNSFSNFQA